MERSYISTPMDEMFVYETVLEHFAKNIPDKPAFIFYTMEGVRSTMTCSELWDKSLLFAKGLSNMGIRKGDIVALSVPNSPEWLVCNFGVILAGGITLGLNFVRRDGKDIEHSITKSGKCTTIIFNGDSYTDYEIMKTIAPTADENGYIRDSNIDGLKYAIYCGKKNYTDFPFNFDHVLGLGHDHKNLVLPTIQPDDVCMILLTSGTTGFSKLATWTHFGVLSYYLSNGKMMDVKQNDIFLNMMPFRGVAGYVFQFLSVGCTWVTIDDLSKAGTVGSLTKTVIQMINNEKCNYAVIEGPCLYSMLTEDSLNLGSAFPIDTIFTGGYPLRHSVAKIVGRVTRRLLYNYASTEMGFYSAKEITHIDDFEDYNCGEPFPDFEIKDVDDDGYTCPRETTGIIHVRSRIPFRGYMNDSESTAQAITDGGWFNTQDLGYVTNGGEIVVYGRKSDIIHVGSINVSPFRVESMIREHPEVKTAIIIPVPDEITYQQLCACVVRKNGSAVTWEEIEVFLRCSISTSGVGLMSNELIPKYHVFLNSLPVTVYGKIKRKELIENCLELLQLK